MHKRADQLDRRKASSASLRRSSTLFGSTDSLQDVPLTAEDGVFPNDKDKQRVQSHSSSSANVMATVWTTLSSLSPFHISVRRRGLPRYDLRTSSVANDKNPDKSGQKHITSDEDDPNEGDVQVIAFPRSSLDVEAVSDSFLDSDEYETEEQQPDDDEEGEEIVTRAEEILLYEQGRKRPRHGWILRRRAPVLKQVDVETYAAKRVMTPLQERWNAWTMIPYPLLCLYYVYACHWIPTTMVRAMLVELQEDVAKPAGSSSWPEDWIGNPSECLPPSSAWNPLPSLPYTPPLPVLAITLAVILHTPWSMLYHWKCQVLPPGSARLDHWSRRMDQAMLHFICALSAYGTSGSFDYLIAVSLFNAESAYRHFLPKVNPRRNKVRLMLGVIAYSVPLLRLGHLDLFLCFWVTTSITLWVFATYPVGGWSHSLFHMLGLLNVIPILVGASLTPAAQHAVTMGAQCTAWRQFASS